MDIYASGQSQPIRIDLFDNEIDTLKFFDPETQRTTESLKQFRVLPAKEFPLKEGRSVFRERYAEAFPTANPKKNPIYQDVLDGIASPGVEFYLPLFLVKKVYNRVVTLLHTYLKIALSLQMIHWMRF